MVSPYTALALGAVFVIVVLALADRIPNPTPYQEGVFRTALALAAAAFAAGLPGFAGLSFSNPWAGVAAQSGWAVGALVLVYFVNPAKFGAARQLTPGERAILFRHLQLLAGQIPGRQAGYLPAALGVPRSTLDALYTRLST